MDLNVIRENVLFSSNVLTFRLISFQNSNLGIIMDTLHLLYRTAFKNIILAIFN